MSGKFSSTVFFSAQTGEGIPNLLQAIENALYQVMKPIKVKIPFSAGRLLDLIHREGAVERVLHQPDGILISGRIPGAYLSEFRPYLRPERGEKP